MSKDRLEEIKQAYGYGCGLQEDTYPFWLIERVQELEIRCAEIAGESAAIEERSFKRIKALESKNKRYRTTVDFLKLKIQDFEVDTREINKLTDEKIIESYSEQVLDDISDTLIALEGEE